MAVIRGVEEVSGGLTTGAEGDDGVPTAEPQYVLASTAAPQVTRATFGRPRRIRNSRGIIRETVFAVRRRGETTGSTVPRRSRLNRGTCSRCRRSTASACDPA